MASLTTPPTVGARIASIAVSIAAAFVILGVSIVPFFTPQWIHGEQDRSHAALLGRPYNTTVQEASDLTVRDLLLGGDFRHTITARCGGLGPCPEVALFDDREVAHMRDVQGVLRGLGLLVLAGLAVLALTAMSGRRDVDRRRRWWRAVGRGARGLAVAMAVIGVLSVVAFDAAFQVFHSLLFPAGSFSFDPATERLVQLYPDQFWSDTALALGIVALVASVTVAFVASRRSGRVPAGGNESRAGASLTPRSAP